ncbi:MAG: metallophosphoesterase [Bacteroidetes bacterium]|nr:metallophosphoesterase [Bacteroidota bacterium]
MLCFFVSDLHGHQHRYEQLFAAIGRERPDAVLLGGDLLPGAHRATASQFPVVTDFIEDYLAAQLRSLQEELGDEYPRVFLILGNDDPRRVESALLGVEHTALWTYLHGRRDTVGEHPVYGYSYVPPSPFQLKDWERYDVSRYVEPGCISPEEGRRSVPADLSETRYATIQDDLAALTADADLARAIMLFHAPPYNTALDRAALDGRKIDHAPLDVHVGSVAIRKFILQRQPRITLHGHIHESASITGNWKEQLGECWCYSAAHRGPELALVRFDPNAPENATRELL